MATKKSGASKRQAGTSSSTKASATKKSASKKSPAKSGSTKKSAAKKTPAKKSAAEKSDNKSALAKKSASKKAAATKKSAAKQASKTTSTTGSSATPASANRSSETRHETPKSTTTETNVKMELPKPRFSKDGLGYTKDFPLTFIKQCYDELQAERVRLTGQANRLEHEAQQLVEDSEMGDVQFDDEGGEGDTLAVERERDLTLSAQARETVREIDEALERIAQGTYGYSVESGRPIPSERLEAIPWSTVLVEEKVGGLGRR